MQEAAKQIVIVEDEWELANNLAKLLDVLGYVIAGVFSNADDCLKYLSANRPPDLILLDISIKGAKSGIDLAREIRNGMTIPIVFCTAHTNIETLEQVTQFKPEGYIIKPFTMDVLRTAIYLALDKKNQDLPSQAITLSTFQVRDKGLIFPVSLNEIIMFRGNGIYIDIVTRQKVYLVRDSLKRISSIVAEQQFVRVHKSYIVNKDFIKSFSYKFIKTEEGLVPIRRGVYQTLQGLFGKKNLFNNN